MKTGRSLSGLINELVRRETVKHDYLVDTRRIRFDADNSHEQISLINDQTNTTTVLDVNSIAHNQIATTLGIPTKYYDKMRKENPLLLATNINSWFDIDPKVKMVRTLDGIMRAFLSDKYYPIDNFLVAEAVLPIIADLPDVRIESCEVTDSRMYIKVVNPRLTQEVVPGDIVQSGMIISNSEVGEGSLLFQPLVYRLVCKNGMVVNDAKMRRTHVGKSNGALEDFSLYTDETIIADRTAILMKAKDAVRAIGEQTRFDRVVNLMRNGKQAKITSTNIPAMVELTGTRFGYTKQQASGILNHLIHDGELSLYGIANAVTKFAQDVQSYDESTRLEGVGYDILSMSKDQWNRLNAVSTVATVV